MTCRSCSAEIFFAISATTGKKIPLNSKADQRGTLVVSDGIAEVDRSNQQVPHYTSHFATCPDANKWRRS